MAADTKTTKADACCAHSEVERVALKNDDDTFSDFWMCSDCGTQFVPLAAIAEHAESYRVLEARLSVYECLTCGASIYGKPHLEHAINCERAGQETSA